MEMPPNEPIKTPISKSDIISEGKTIAIIAYITFIGLIIAFVLNMEKKNSFALFHIRQSLGLVLVALVLGVINIIPILGWVISIIGSIILFIMWISSLMSALNGNEKPVFLLGEKFQEWFKDI